MTFIISIGYSAIVFTVDMPIVGKREQDERNGFFLPSEFSLKILSEVDDSK
jgi:isopentenyl diphosphate isomerase/L-lactate dehydrogenase-like FMN-dependent dehydrogenase